MKTVGATVLGGLWAWHSAEICTPNLNSLAPIVSEISAFIRTDRRTDGDPDQEYIYFLGSETLPSACYILSDKSSIPFYSTSNGYKNFKELILVFEAFKINF